MATELFMAELFKNLLFRVVIAMSQTAPTLRGLLFPGILAWAQQSDCFPRGVAGAGAATTHTPQEHVPSLGWADGAPLSMWLLGLSLCA